MYRRSQTRSRRIAHYAAMLLFLVMLPLLAAPAPQSAMAVHAAATPTPDSGRAVPTAQPTTSPATEEAAPEALPITSGALGDTLVVLAETSATAGVNPLSFFENRVCSVAWYYSLNSGGAVKLNVSLLHHDDARAWYNLGATLCDYRDRQSFAEAALRRALADMQLPAAVRVERVIVVYADGGQAGPVPCNGFSTSTTWFSREHYLEVNAGGRAARLYFANLVLLGERDDLGAWAHEIAHTLPTQLPSGDGYQRIADRYDYQGVEGEFVKDRPDQGKRRTGYVGHWDVMGLGVLWGTPEGSSPTHMCSYTKVAAGWLRYQAAELGRAYVLNSLEYQSLEDAVLRLDDPRGDDPTSYYIVEARDRDVFFGAPESGIVIYHVTRDPETGKDLVEVLQAQAGPIEGNGLGRTYRRPALHGVGQADGSTEYVIEGSIKVTLLAESFAPYRATIRIERSQS